MNHLTSRALVLALSTAASSAYAQRPIDTLVGPSDGIGYGHAVAGIDDVDGDGRPDVVFANRRYTNTAGDVQARSGHDLSLLYTLPNAGFWRIDDLLAAGDLTGDGRRELVAIGPDSSNAAWVWLFDGADGDEMAERHLLGLGVQDLELKLLGDVDGDEVPDFLATDGNQDLGIVLVLSGADLSELRRHETPWPSPHCHTIDAGRDADGDGVPDYVISWARVGGPVHAVEVRSGATGHAFTRFLAPGDYLACQDILLVPDINGDDRADVVFVDFESPGRPRPFVHSSADGSLIMAPPAVDVAGFWDRTQADVDGDGTDDLLFGYDRVGTSVSFLVYRGGDFSPRYQTAEPLPDYSCFRFIANAGDIDGDSIDDLVTGCEAFSTNHPTLPQHANRRGLIGLFSGTGASPLGAVSCGAPKTNSTGRPAQLLVHGSASLSAGDLRLTARDLPPGEFGYFLASPQLAPTTLPGAQGEFCLGSPLAAWRQKTTLASPLGAISIQVDPAVLPTTPPTPVMVGETWHFQAWYRDRDPGDTSRFTEAIELTFE